MKTIKIEMTIEDWNELAKAAEDRDNFKKWYYDEKTKREKLELSNLAQQESSKEELEMRSKN